MTPSVLPISLNVDGKECVSRNNGSYLVWSALKKLDDREYGEITFDCPFKPMEKGFVHVDCNFFFLFLCSSDLGSSDLPDLLCSTRTGEYVNK